MFGFCCVSRREEDEGNMLNNQTKLGLRQHTDTILAQFEHFEDEIIKALSSQNCEKFIIKLSKYVEQGSKRSKEELIIQNQAQFYNKSIKRRQVFEIIKGCPGIETNQIFNSAIDTKILQFKHDGENLDLEKLMCFLALYSSSNEVEKNSYLFDLIVDPEKEVITYESCNIPRIVEHIVRITCLEMSQFVLHNQDYLLPSKEEQLDFKELFELFDLSQKVVLQEFCIFLRGSLFFPLEQNKKSGLNKKQFLKLMAQNILVCPEKIRLEFTRHVYNNEYKVRSSYNASQTPYQINVLSQSVVNSSVDNIKVGNRGTIDSHKERYLKEADQPQKIMLNQKPKKKKGIKKDLDNIKEDGEEVDDFMDILDKEASYSKQLASDQKQLAASMTSKKPFDSSTSKIMVIEEEEQDLKNSIIQNLNINTSANKSKRDKSTSKKEKKEKKDKKKKKRNESSSNQDIIINDEVKQVSFHKKEQRSLLAAAPEDFNGTFGSVAKNDQQWQEESLNIKPKKKRREDKGFEEAKITPSGHLKKDQRPSMLSQLNRAPTVVREIEPYMIGLYGEQFYQFVVLLAIEGQADFEEDQMLSDVDHENNLKVLQARNDRFRHNKKLIQDRRGFQIEFPKIQSDKFPTAIKEILVQFQQTIKANDIVLLHNGTLYNEDVLNLYFKIMERINQVLITAQNFFKQQTPDPVLDRMTENTSVDKVHYFTTNSVRKLRKETSFESLRQNKTIVEELKKVFDSDVLLVPFFFEETQQSFREGTYKTQGTIAQPDYTEPLYGSVLVSINTNSMKIDLFDRVRRDTTLSIDNSEIKNQTVSDEVLKLLTYAAALSNKKGGVDFNENEVDGGVESVCVQCEEDYFVAMAYIAEAVTFKRVIDLSLLNVQREREKMCDLFLQLLQFK